MRSLTDRVLTRVELNRALLARQLLLERKRMSVPRAVERLAGLQAQYTPSPYLSLLARVDGLRRDTLTAALQRRLVVKAWLMRGTLHLVTPRDYWAFAAARRIRVPRHAFVVHAPPSGTWGYHGEGVYEAAENALAGAPPEPAEAVEHLVRRYLAAFGPASAQDVAQWSGLLRTGPLAETMARMELRTFADEGGRTLHDLPRAPLPNPETPAPPRLVPRYDNLLLAHADRTRILGEVPVGRIVMKNGLVHATILVDGFVAGIWQLEGGRVRLEPFERLPKAVRAALDQEVARVESFVA
jgi:hypothetical protein